MPDAKHNSNYLIFVVEDNVLYANILRRQLKENSFRVKVFETGGECLAHLDEMPDVISLDYTLPDSSGKEILAEIRKVLPSTHVIIISAQDDIATAVELLKNGAYDYIVKGPDTRERLANIISKIYQSDQLRNENLNLKDAVKEKYNFHKLIKGNSREIEQIFELMEKAVKTNISVSISGETGTGKELVAKGIHFNSKRTSNPFVAVNVSAIPPTLIESELFGYEKGSFTGAESKKIGKFEQAHTGTLFLDEIADLDLNVQSKLLRVIQEREITRVGGNEVISIDVRIITATHKNLAQLVSDKKFREDLYYRLLGLPIHLPPLRDRGNDIIMLAKYFIDDFCRDNQIIPKRLTADAKEALLSYTFPGNIRELKAVTELACVLTNLEQIDANDLNLNVRHSVKNLLASEKTLDEYNADIIQHFLMKYNNNVRLVANKLKIGKSTIYRLLHGKELQEV